MAAVDDVRDRSVCSRVNCRKPTLEAISNQPVNATFTTSTPWIDLDSAGGQTPALTTVVINPIGLAEGVQVGSITVNSDLGIDHRADHRHRDEQGRLL